MKIGEAIERADALRPNPFSNEEKMQWLSELDGKIAKEILGKSSFEDYSLKDFRETELLVRTPYTDVYLFYLCAMIDFFSRDYADYNNSMLMANSALESFAKAVMRGDEIYEVSDGNTDINTGNGDGGSVTKSTGKRSDRYYINIF